MGVKLRHNIKQFIGVVGLSIDANKKSRLIWDDIASWWDKEVGDGDYFRRELIYPNLTKLLEPCNSDNLLDLGCGNGAVARFLEKQVKSILAVDFSEILINLAKQRMGCSSNISYKCVNLADYDMLQMNIPQKKYNKAIYSMSLQDMSDIGVSIKFLSENLSGKATVVVSMPHPCFNSGNTEIFVAENTAEPRQGVLQFGYAKSGIFETKAKNTQPRPHFIFHRTLSEITSVFFDNSFALTGCIEPTLSVTNKGEGGIWDSY